jgi:hypothetical protein
MELKSKMVGQLGKRDYEYSPEMLRQKPFELWAKVDSLGRKLIWHDTRYKIVVDCYENPTLLRLFTEATIGEKKVGELICSEAEYFGKKYTRLYYVNIDKLHKGAGYSYKMMNCLIAILPQHIEGIITQYTDRIEPEPVKKLFTNLAGFVNDFGYLEIKNPKNQP